MLNSKIGLELGIDTLPSPVLHQCNLRMRPGPPITAQYWLQTRGVKGASALLGINSTALDNEKSKREVLGSVPSISNAQKKKKKANMAL